MALFRRDRQHTDPRRLQVRRESGDRFERDWEPSRPTRPSAPVLVPVGDMVPRDTSFCSLIISPSRCSGFRYRPKRSCTCRAPSSRVRRVHRTFPAGTSALTYRSRGVEATRPTAARSRSGRTSACRGPAVDDDPGVVAEQGGTAVGLDRTTDWYRCCCWPRPVVHDHGHDRLEAWRDQSRQDVGGTAGGVGRDDLEDGAGIEFPPPMQPARRPKRRAR